MHFENDRLSIDTGRLIRNLFAQQSGGRLLYARAARFRIEPRFRAALQMGSDGSWRWPIRKLKGVDFPRFGQRSPTEQSGEGGHEVVDSANQRATFRSRG